MKKMLYIDACICRSTSRTERLAQAFLKKAGSAEHFDIETVILEEEDLHPLQEADLAMRSQRIGAKDFSGEMFRLARSFAEADELVIAAPYWDMSFPASVKLFCEQICINGLTFRYNERGIPCGLTKIRKATYITTSGGCIGNFNFGYDYVKGLLQGLFTVSDIRFICAEGLDIQGNDPETVLAEAIARL